MAGVFCTFCLEKVTDLDTVKLPFLILSCSEEVQRKVYSSFTHIEFYFLCLSFSETLRNKKIVQASYTCSVSAFKKTEIKHSLTVRGNY